MKTLSTRREPWVLLFIAVALVAANLRMTITGVGPLLEQIATDQGVSTAALGALGSLPLIAWAVFSPLAHAVSARFGLTNAVTCSLIVLAAGTAWRSLPGSPANLWLGTVIIGVGLALANVLMPAAIKRDFPRRLGPVMGAYTALLGGFAALTAGLSVPLSQLPTAHGPLGWQVALLLSGTLLPPAIIVWIWAHRARRGRAATILGADPTADAHHSVEARGSQTPGRSAPSSATDSTLTASAAGTASADRAGRRIWGDGLAWLVSVYMGVQSVSFYVMATWFVASQTSRGVAPVEAGVTLMVFQLCGIGGSLLMPVLAHGRLKRWLPGLVPVFGLTAWLGIPLAPQAMPLWIGVGGLVTGASLTVSLTLMAVRARTAMHSTALSGMAQSVGYGIAAVGPITFGAIQALTGEWVLPFAVMWVSGALQIIIGIAVGRPRFVLER